MLCCGRWTMLELDQCTGPTTVPSSNLCWHSAKDGNVPKGAIAGGCLPNMEICYIGRTRLLENHNQLTPGLVIPSQKCLLVSYGTGVRTANEYEVLASSDSDSVHWVRCSGGNVPLNAVIGGIDCSYLEPLYIGRTVGSLNQGRTWRGKRLELSFDSVQIPGKVHPTHKCLYIPFDGKEYLFRNYEVLALKGSPANLLCLCKQALRSTLLQGFGCSKDSDFDDNVHTKMNAAVDGLPLPEKIKEYCKAGFVCK